MDCAAGHGRPARIDQVSQYTFSFEALVRGTSVCPTVPSCAEATSVWYPAVPTCTEVTLARVTSRARAEYDTRPAGVGGEYDTRPAWFGGVSSARCFGGARSARRFGGVCGARRYGGVSNARRFGGVSNARRFGGVSNARRLF